MKRKRSEISRKRIQASIAYSYGRKDDAAALRMEADKMEREQHPLDVETQTLRELKAIERENMLYWQKP